MWQGLLCFVNMDDAAEAISDSLSKRNYSSQGTRMSSLLNWQSAALTATICMAGGAAGMPTHGAREAISNAGEGNKGAEGGPQVEEAAVVHSDVGGAAADSASNNMQQGEFAAVPDAPGSVPVGEHLPVAVDINFGMA